MAQQTRGYAHRVDIRAGIDEVWRSLTDPERLARWLASQARVDAREGGSYWLRVDANLTREAHIDVYLPPKRLRLIYMPMADLPTDDAVIVDDFLLHTEPAKSDKAPAQTIVRLLGSGIPEGIAWDPVYLRLRSLWERGLLKLRASLEPGRPTAPKPGAPKK